MKKLISLFLCAAMVVSVALSGGTVSAQEDIKYTGTVDSLNAVTVNNEDITYSQEFFTGNVALGKTATASGSESDTWTPDKAVDGSQDTRWASERVYNTPPVTDFQWIALDLGNEVTDITEIKLYFDQQAWSTDFNIETRASESDEWTKVKNVVTESANEPNKVITVTDVSKLDRYVRFYFNSLNSNAAWGTISVKEIEILGTQTTGGDLEEFVGNVALGKTAAASDSENTTWTPDKTVDGDTASADSRWSSGRTMWNDPVIPQWIQLDLKTNVTDITEIKVYFNAKVWATKYQIQTRSSVNDEWRTVKDISVESSDETNKIDTFTDVKELDRYVRFYFTEINSKAIWDAISVKEIEIYGTQLIDPNMPSSASEIMNKITSLPALTADSASIELPQVHDNYKIFIKGSEVKNVINLDNEVTPYNIGSRDVNVILRVENKENPEDYAEKSFAVTVPDKTSKYPDLYPEIQGEQNAEPNVIPSIQEWYGYTGNFEFENGLKVVLNDAASLNASKAADKFKDFVSKKYGFDLNIVNGVDGDATSKDIYIETMSDDKYDVGEEGYLIIINDNGIKIYASGYTGVHYALITLEQIMVMNDGLIIPKGVIRDYSNYEIRGAMIDIARAPYTYEMLIGLMDVLSWYKINEVHFHINDNKHEPNGDVTSYEHWRNIEGYFRLESDTFPSLTSTAKTNEYYNNVMGGTPSYTKEQWKELQQYAVALGIDPITEIDMPGHSLALTKYVYENSEEAAAAGITGPVNSTRNWELLSLEDGRFENSLKMVKLLFDEYLDEEDPVFLSDTVHIGIDEYWNIQQSERANMITLIDEVKALLESKGKTVRVWSGLGSYTGSNISDYNDMVMDCWATSWDSPFQRLKDGFKIINVDQPLLYNNPMRDGKDVINVEWIFENWDPTVFAAGKVTKGDPGLLGAKTATWADVNYMGVTEKDCYERIVRSAAVLSEKTWGGVRSSDTYENYELTFSKLFNQLPDNYATKNIENSLGELVAYYDFSNGEAVDMSGSGNDGIVANPGEIADGMMTFNGNTTVKTGVESLSYPYTVSFDIQLDEGNTDDTDIFIGTGTDGRLYVKADGTIGLNRNYFEQTFGYKLPLNEKHNITVVGTHQATKLYVDGVLIKHLGRVDGSETNYDNPASTFVFPFNEIGTNFHGKIGNVAAYTKALSAQEIAALAKGEMLTKVNVAQNKGVAGDGQTIGMGNDGADWKKIRVGWKATDGEGFALDGGNGVAVSERDSFFEGNYNEAFLTVDLWEEYSIDEIVLQWDRTPGSYTIKVSNDGESWMDVKTVTHTSASKAEDVIKISELGSSDISNNKYRYVKMQSNSLYNGTTFKLREFMVYNYTDKAELESLYAELDKLMTDNNLDIGDVNSNEIAKCWLTVGGVLKNQLATENEISKATAYAKDVIAGIESPAFEKGDVNHDNRITILDATLIQKFIVKIDVSSEFFESEADMNGDNKITIFDATLIQVALAKS